MRRPVDTARAERRLRLLRAALTTSDVLLIHREASPLSRGAIERELIAAAGASIFDFDDALHVQPSAVSLRRRLLPLHRKVLACVRSVDRVIAGNEVLADWASRHAGDVRVIPTCVAIEDYVAKSSFDVAEAPVIGWLGSPATEPHLISVADALREVNRRTGARVEVVSSGDAHLGPLDGIVDRIEWTPDAAATRLALWDVGIMPLPDLPYERGKCAYKLLQYGAVGLPAVASPVGANASAINDLGMAAATTTDEWIDALLAELTSSAEDRSTRGTRARTSTNAQYSYRRWAPEWLSAVEA